MNVDNSAINDIAIIARASERLLVAFIAGLSIYYGYRLFLANLELDVRIDSEVKYKEWLIRLRGVGPGIFLHYLVVEYLFSQFKLRSQFMTGIKKC
jgi:hypothetical protein